MSLGQTLSNCLLLGPAYLPVQQLALQPAIQSAVTNLIEQLNSAVNSQSSPWGPFQVNETFFSAGMFEVNTPDLIFQYDWNVPGGVALASGSKPTTDNNTIYRIGSISKVFTVYTQLLEKGTSFWSEPITRYIPEIAQAAANQSLSNPVQYPDWQDITIGELASQLADIGRGDYFAPPLPSMPGLPPSTPSACVNWTSCTRSELLQEFLNYPAIFLPSTTPIYSNIAYQLLAWALEGATGKSFPQMLDSDLLVPLQMSNTSYFPPDIRNSLVLNDTSEDWASPTTIIGPGGAIYSTVNDLARFGRSILNSTLLPSVETRRWLKPHSHTANIMLSVGAPWEIHRAVVNGRVVDFYAKDGAIDGYSSELYLMPDYNAGFVTLAAGSTSGQVAALTANYIADTMLPALEQVARAQALKNFGGTYQGVQNNLNASMVIDVDPALSGLRLAQFHSNGTDILQSLIALVGEGGISFQLQPTNTKTQNQISFRVLAEIANPVIDGGIASSQCSTWTSVDSERYGIRPLDDFIFDVNEDGEATQVTPTLLGVTMQRVASSASSA